MRRAAAKQRMHLLRAERHGLAVIFIGVYYVKRSVFIFNYRYKMIFIHPYYGLIAGIHSVDKVFHRHFVARSVYSVQGQCLGLRGHAGMQLSVAYACFVEVAHGDFSAQSLQCKKTFRDGSRGIIEHGVRRTVQYAAAFIQKLFQSGHRFIESTAFRQAFLSVDFFRVFFCFRQLSDHFFFA